jgi:hypothetical protein
MIFYHVKGKESYLSCLAKKYLKEADKKDTDRYRVRKNQYKSFLKDHTSPKLEAEIRNQVIKVMSSKVTNYKKFLEQDVNETIGMA